MNGADPTRNDPEARYEYVIVQMSAGGRSVHLNERINNMVQEGWEPVMMTGDATVSVMLRRPLQQAQQVGQAQAAAAQPQAVAATPGGTG